MEQARDGARHHRGAARGDRGADPRAARGARLPHGERAHRRRRRRHPGARRRPRRRKSTVLTTIDENAGLEVYINVPVQEAREAEGRPARPPRRRSRAASSPPSSSSFVSPSVDARDAVGAGEGDARAGRGPADRAVRPRADRLERGAGAHRAARRASTASTASSSPSWPRTARAGRPWPASAPWSSGPVVGNDYVVQVRPEAGREADRVRRAEDRRRRARDDRSPPARRGRPAAPAGKGG